ncbi:MAG TPA: hypothetical protein PL152_01930 [Steroidobacteraceae bacterium]|nr:hypothetical protein [Steroidobacteraceae bacterium]
MRVTNPMSRVLRGGIAAFLAAGSIAPALAGGPLYVTPVNGVMTPLHWVGTVPVHLDSGNLNVGTDCVRDPVTYECVLDGAGNPVIPVLDQKAGDDLVAATVYQWSHVPTSSFRAQVVDRSPVDITGANVSDYIGTYNGGGIQTIYDADNSVIDALTGGDGYGVLGIASPEYASDSDPTQIIEGWQVIGGSFLNATSTEQISGVVTHEFGHAINLAHTQVNGFLQMNDPTSWSFYAGGNEQAGPDQCGPAAAGYPAANQIETMYPMIDPFPQSPTYNSPEMAKVLDDADDMAALSSIYPATGYAATTGTIHGRIVAKDGKSQLTGINVIARRADKPLTGAISRISGDSTQGLLGADGSFTMTGLVPGVNYLLYIDQLRAGAYSTPKALLLGPEEYWNAGESGDASKDDACASTPISVAAGETREITIAVNGIARAPGFTVIPYVMPQVVSDNGQKVAGIYGPSNESPYWVWDKTSFAKTGDVTFIGGSGVTIAMSGNGRVVGGTVAGPTVTTSWGDVVQQRAALWTKEGGWKTITKDNWPGCDIFHTSIFDLSTDGSTAVGLAFKDCTHVYGFKWNARTGVKLLSKVGTDSARANAVSGNGGVVVGWQDMNDTFPYRIGSIWQGSEQTILREPRSVSDYNPTGYVGEVLAINSAGNVAVGYNAGPDLNDSFIWTPYAGTRNLGGDRKPFCFKTWDDTGAETTVCNRRQTIAYAISDDARVITGETSYNDFWNASAIDGAIFTPKLGWMQLSAFLQSQGVLEATNWVFLGTKVSADGKTLIGTGAPLGADYYQGYRIDLDQVFVCAGRGRYAKTLKVDFPIGMDIALAAGAKIGLCPGDAPL